MNDAELEKTAQGGFHVNCHSCGAELKFKPGTDHLECGYCGAQNEIERSEVEIEEKDLHAFLDVIDRPSTAVEILDCKSCGASNPFKDVKVAQNCLFCGAHLLVKDAQKIDQYRADALIPFQLTKRDVVLLWDEWVKQLWWAPNDLKKMSNGTDGVKGIYIPYWTFDARTESAYTGQRGEYRYVKDGDKKKRVTDWYPASGHVSVLFDDVLVVASNSLPKKQEQKLQPWDMKQMVPFQEEYLKGFIVETYSEKLADAAVQAKAIMTEVIRTHVRRDIGGDTQQITSVNTDWQDQTFKLILLPIYISAYQFKGKTYRYLVNGQTGEVQGERPYSFWKIAGAVLLVLFIIALILLLSKE